MQITKQLRGKVVAAVETNGHILSIRTYDGSEIRVVWVDDNGEPIKGKPMLQSRGLTLRAYEIESLNQRAS